MFSQTIEYALRALYCLALNSDKARTTKYLPSKMEIPASYLAKIMQNVTRAGIVTSQRGAHGGFMLIKPPDEVTLASIIAAVDPITPVCQCPLHIEDHHDHLCPLHHRLNLATEMILELFENTTLDDLLAETQ